MLEEIFSQGYNSTELAIALLSVLIVSIFSLAYHEYGHALVADSLGDPTPRQQGALTLDPFPHLRFMSVVFLILFGFGWSTSQTRPDLIPGNPRRAFILVAIAGPLANLLMASLFALPYQLIEFGLLDGAEFSASMYAYFFRTGIYINILLLTFNLIPLPPLDGFMILVAISPAPVANFLIKFGNSNLGGYALIAFIVLLPLAGYDILGFLNPIVDSIILFLSG